MNKAASVAFVFASMVACYILMACLYTFHPSRKRLLLFFLKRLVRLRNVTRCSTFTRLFGENARYKKICQPLQDFVLYR